MYCNYQISLNKNSQENHDSHLVHSWNKLLTGLVVFIFFLSNQVSAQQQKATNPVIFADVPDMSMIRVNDTYYMSSTTMHMSPGVPIMKSKDLVNWQIINYVYDTLADVEELNLENGKSTYGRGSWASCLRYHNGVYYVSTFSQTTNTTYIYTTKNIETGPWRRASFKPSYHDHTIFFDDDCRVFLIYGAGRLKLLELTADASAVKSNTEQIIIENASASAGSDIGLQSEGSQLFKIDGKYYLFNIVWPKGGMRTVIIHRADKITGPYEGRIALQDRGVAQGGLIDTPDKKWFAYLFRDYGSVGRIPYLVPVTWKEGWPVLGNDGKIPDTLDLPASTGLQPGIVAPDEFNRKKSDPALPLVWQWNHNPDHRNWSVSERNGFLRLRTNRIDTSFLSARNTLTQRSFGPESSGIISLDISNMKNGDMAGLALLQKKFGFVAVNYQNGVKSIVMVSAESGAPIEKQRLPLTQNKVYLRADCNFRDLRDEANFYYSLDGESWKSIGVPLKMSYTLPHFMGYRFGLFNYATQSVGGFVDFDFFRLENKILKQDLK